MIGHAQRHSSSVGVDIGGRLIPLVLFAAFVALYSIHPNNYPHHDELYHVLAGAAWAESGSLALGDGVYQRAPLYTKLIGELFGLFGVSLGLARLPAILASALCVALIYVFVRPLAGRTEAAVAAVGFGLCPLFADVAKMVRFYGFHTLLFVLAAFAVYWASAIATRLPQRALGFALAAACLLGALYFQRTTLIGMVGLGVWAGGCLALEILGPTRRLIAAAGLALLALVAALLVAHEAGILANALEVYRGTAPWAAERADYEGFYLDRLLAYYPVVLPLFPLAALYAFARWPALTVFCATLFGVGMVLHTFAGMKAERYVTYLMPFFWIVLGLASAPLIVAARRAIATVSADVAGMAGLRFVPTRLLAAVARTAAIASIAGFAVIAVAVPDTLHKLVHRIDHPPPEWSALPEVLGLGEAGAPVLLTPNALHVLYFVGDFHAELGPAAEDAGSQVGRPLVTDAAHLARIIACHPAGALVADPWRWNNSGVVAAGVRDHAQRHLEPHPAGPALNLEIYTWHHGRPPGADCGDAALAERPLRLQPLARP